VCYDAPGTEIFQSLGLFSIIAWVTLTALSLLSNVGEVVVSRIERYQRLNATVKKYMKGFYLGRVSVLRASSHHTGHARASRAHSHSNASKDGSDDGESDSEDPPAPPLFSVVPSRIFTTYTHDLKHLPNG
jgi:hypothetical protein